VALRQPPSIDAYGGGGFRVSGEWREGSLLILQDEPRAWPVTRLADLTAVHLADVLAAGVRDVEFVLLGVGPSPAPAPRAVREALQQAGMGLEVMDTAAAARTYNVIVGQGRRIAAALIAV
jgi:uncharacterized protein